MFSQFWYPHLASLYILPFWRWLVFFRSCGAWGYAPPSEIVNVYLRNLLFLLTVFFPSHSYVPYLYSLLICVSCQKIGMTDTVRSRPRASALAFRMFRVMKFAWLADNLCSNQSRCEHSVCMIRWHTHGYSPSVGKRILNQRFVSGFCGLIFVCSIVLHLFEKVFCRISVVLERPYRHLRLRSHIVHWCVEWARMFC